MREHLIRTRPHSEYTGPRLPEVCFEDILQAGKAVENMQESERRTQQDREGKQRNSGKGGQQNKDKGKGTGGGVKKNQKKIQAKKSQWK